MTKKTVRGFAAVKRRIPPKVDYNKPRVLDYSKMMPRVNHGIDCHKAPHLSDGGYLHAENNNLPYDVDGRELLRQMPSRAMTKYTQEWVDAHQARVKRKAIQPAPTGASPKKPKYGNVKTAHAGKMVDSSKEARRRAELELLQKAGEIEVLRYAVRYDLIVNGILVCWYEADAVYWHGGDVVVEDTKSEPTRKNRAYRIKVKLMRAVHGIEIKEV